MSINREEKKQMKIRNPYKKMLGGWGNVGGWGKLRRISDPAGSTGEPLSNQAVDLIPQGNPRDMDGCADK